jgi:EAL domain-containing protein (putative c-di-GMP-specific phosphodiesterase class I)
MTEQAKPPIDPSDLARAIKSDELRLMYQPKIALHARSLTGVEALARWHHPDFGNIPPSDFIPVAEEHGLIDALTEWAVATAAAAWVAWRGQGLITNIAVNFSALSLDRLEFPDIIQNICQQQGMPCEHLVIELTETATSGQIELLDTMTRFRIKDFRISLDDFGTGYSSLVQILRAPFSELKIDRSVVVDSDTSKDCRIMLKAIIDLAHNLDLPTVAEGVETQAVATLLEQLGCDMAQGYFFSRPLPVDAVAEWAENFRLQQRVSTPTRRPPAP